MDTLHTKYKACIEACLRCYAAAQHCIARCIKSEEVEHMRACIQLNQQTAAVCLSTVNLLTLQSPFVSTLLKLCDEVCSACAAECEQHENEHCQECAVHCKHCAEECRLIAVQYA